MTAQTGFLGLGQMGGPMAERLIDSGIGLNVFDPDEQAAARLVAKGALPSASPRDAAEGCAIVFACLPNPHVSRAVLGGPEGVAAAAPLIYVEMSNIGSEAVADVRTALPASTALLDAPVSGGPRGARAGTLNTMVAGEADIVARARPLLETIAQNVFHVGATPGQGQVAKLANNMISAASMVASFEAVMMGVKAGLDAGTLVDVINKSTGRCGATLDKFPASILPRRFDYGGKSPSMSPISRCCPTGASKRSSPACASPARTARLPARSRGRWIRALSGLGDH